jgi:hypothetical protein
MSMLSHTLLLRCLQEPAHHLSGDRANLSKYAGLAHASAFAALVRLAVKLPDPCRTVTPLELPLNRLVAVVAWATDKLWHCLLITWATFAWTLPWVSAGPAAALPTDPSARARTAIATATGNVNR